MVALLLYAYAIGERSSRAIERRCREDIAFRVITANQAPDHATIARFGVRHESALRCALHRGACSVRERRAGSLTS
jgi:transposase